MSVDILNCEVAFHLPILAIPASTAANLQPAPSLHCYDSAPCSQPNAKVVGLRIFAVVKLLVGRKARVRWRAASLKRPPREDTPPVLSVGTDILQRGIVGRSRLWKFECYATAARIVEAHEAALRGLGSDEPMSTLRQSRRLLIFHSRSYSPQSVEVL